MALYNYTVLVQMSPEPSWLEYYVMAFVWTLTVEKIREVIVLVFAVNIQSYFILYIEFITYFNLFCNNLNILKS